MVEDEVFWQALVQQPVFAARHDSALDRAGDRRWRCGSTAASRGRGFLRLAYFTPTVLPMIAVANIWLFFYTPQYGLLEQITRRARPAEPQLARRPEHRARRDDRRRGLEGGRLLHDLLPRRAAAHLARRSREAAALEGASRWQYFRRVLFPLLMPTTLFVLINALINSVRLVDHIFVMTRGGPDNASALLLYYIYQVGLQLLGLGLCRRAHRGAAGGARRCVAFVPVPLPRPADALPVSA